MIKRLSYFILFLVLILCLTPVVFGQKVGQIKLLAVSQVGDEMEGNTADLFLELIPGNGRIFLDTFPLTKLDTQMSTRFAKEIACNHYDIDCSKYDFIYTIRAKSSIVGGPSAGAAISVLTSAMLLDKEIPDDIAVTGTINSGSIVGMVSGIKEKIEGAAQLNLTQVFIPQGARMFTEFTDVNNTNPYLNETENKTQINTTIDLVEYGKTLGVEVIEVSFLDDLMGNLTGHRKKLIKKNITTTESYEETMKNVAAQLCNRTEMLFGKLDDIDYTNNSNYQLAVNQTKKGKLAIEHNRHYSSASYCFGANVRISTILANQSNINVMDNVVELRKLVLNFSEDFNNNELSTITDLQTFIIVNERASEALEIISNINDSYDFDNYAYAAERFYSALSWSKFWGTGKKGLVMDENALRESCIIKLKESEERYQYVNLIFPNMFTNIKELNEKAYQEMENEQYDLCLFKASKAKAQSNVFLGMLGNTEERLTDMVNTKMYIIEQLIIEQSEKGNFPILGYSYYEYAKSLMQYDKYSSLLYSEYALEIADLDMYFKSQPQQRLRLEFDSNKVLIFAIGIIIGMLISFLIMKTSSTFVKINN